MAEEAARAGTVGEEMLIKLLFLAVVSRFCQTPVSIVPKGPSSAGKSHTVKQVLKFFPTSAYCELTSMSEKALLYFEEPLKHRFLYIQEADGASNENVEYSIRALLSEGQLRYVTVEKTEAGMHLKEMTVEGPTGLIMTTTKIALHPENETRYFSPKVNDTPQQTKAVMTAMARGNRYVIDYGPFHDLQTFLEGAEHRVVIPYLEQLADLICPVATRMRRDFGKIITLIEAHAILHQAQRERDEDGRIVATPDDYAAVHELVANLVSEGVEATVPATVRETVETVKRLTRERSGTRPGGVRALPGITKAEIAKALGLDKSAGTRRVNEAIRRGYLMNAETNNRRPARIVVHEPMPEDAQVIPSPEQIADRAAAGTPPRPSAGSKSTERRVAVTPAKIKTERNRPDKDETEWKWITF